MAPFTHAFIGWWVANAVPLARRDRLAVFAAGLLPDADGVTLLHSWEAYLRWHHVVGHNLFLALAFAVLVAALTRDRLKCAALTLVNFHLHLAADYWGSAGPDHYVWVLAYLWPAVGGFDADGRFVGPAWYWNPWQWDLVSWPNLWITLVTGAACVYVAVRLDRTPFEFVKPSFDREVCQMLRRWFGGTATGEWTPGEARLVRLSVVGTGVVAMLACAAAGAGAAGW